MIGTTARLDNYPFALASELRDAANEHGFRIGPEQASGWIFFRSASAPGEIAVAAAGNDGPFFLSITHSGVARELAAEPAQPCAKGHIAAFALPTRDALFEAVGEVYRKSVSLPTLPLEQFERETATLGNTEIERIEKVRIGQGIFRKALLTYWKDTCPITASPIAHCYGHLTSFLGHAASPMRSGWTSTMACCSHLFGMPRSIRA